MHNSVYLGFDFGMRRIGLAVGQKLTQSASPLPTLQANNGIPSWDKIRAEIKKWAPVGLIVGLPRTLDDNDLYVTAAAKNFANELALRFALPVHMEDERLSTVEARAELFAMGGYRKMQKSALDSIAACVILEQWLRNP